MTAETPQPPVGIDLGTTYSVTAYLDATGRPVTVRNGQGDLLTPTRDLRRRGRYPRRQAGRQELRGCAGPLCRVLQARHGHCLFPPQGPRPGCAAGGPQRVGPGAAEGGRGAAVERAGPPAW